ncbi:MAG: recombination mediator RecR [Candidatus Falkowbacteria bacterium]
MRFPRAITNLIEAFSQLPSVGPKTAERYVFHLLKSSPEKLENLAKSLAELKNNITVCPNCLAISETSPCTICDNPSRRNGVLCIVENIQDLASIEATKQYQGQYFILGGLINTIENVKPENLNIQKLLSKIKQENYIEIILALNFTLEGETTALYLNKILQTYNLKITRLAKGLPAGSDLEYADETTLATALKYRTENK